LSEDDLSQDEDLDNMFDEDDDDDTANIPEESKISKILSDQTTKTVIILVLCLLFCLPASRWRPTWETLSCCTIKL